jgi:hypothetical protein
MMAFSFLVLNWYAKNEAQLGYDRVGSGSEVGLAVRPHETLFD